MWKSIERDVTFRWRTVCMGPRLLRALTADMSFRAPKLSHLEWFLGCSCLTWSAFGRKIGSPTRWCNHPSVYLQAGVAGTLGPQLTDWSVSPGSHLSSAMYWARPNFGTLLTLPYCLPSGANLSLCSYWEHRPGRNGGPYLGACWSTERKDMLNFPRSFRTGHWLPTRVFISSFSS